MSTSEPEEFDPLQEYAPELASLPRRGLYFQGLGQGEADEPTERQLADALDAEIRELVAALRQYLDAFRAWQIDRSYYRLLVRVAQDDKHPLSRWAHKELQAFDKTDRYDAPLRAGRELELSEETAQQIDKLQSLLELRDRMQAH